MESKILALVQAIYFHLSIWWGIIVPNQNGFHFFPLDTGNSHSYKNRRQWMKAMKGFVYIEVYLLFHRCSVASMNPKYLSFFLSYSNTKYFCV
jgi:hypothetical protein